MIVKEPRICVGVIGSASRIEGQFQGSFQLDGRIPVSGDFSAVSLGHSIEFRGAGGESPPPASHLDFHPDAGASFVLRNVTLGIGFHWEQREDQIFPGSLRLLLRADGTMAVVNELGLEEYLASVISSEMNAGNSAEFLKAQAIASRSWLLAMLERENETQSSSPSTVSTGDPDRIVRWYSRENHDLYDVCADDHCQRYQGVTRAATPAVLGAVEATRGVFLVYGDQVCDARFSKACGGIAEEFSNVWEDRDVPYLRTFSDSLRSYQPVRTEAEADRWIRTRPDAYCNVTDPDILRQVLPHLDQKTQDFFRWSVHYERGELEELIRSKGSVDVGVLHDLVPEARGASGRIMRLRIVGSRRTIVVGKELEIRKWLSPSHLYSSAFVVRKEGQEGGIPAAFALHGAGWGHGVGLCQIGAAVMALKGYSAEEILNHYFRGAALRRLY